MCVVTAEVFNKNPKAYFKRAQSETVTVVTDIGSFSIQPKIPNAETIAAMEEGEALFNNPNVKKYTSVEELFADMDAELERGEQL